MEQKRFKDTRNSLMLLIQHFNSEPFDRSMRDRKFENIVEQVLMRKSIVNYELFSLILDYSYENRIVNKEEFFNYINPNLNTRRRNSDKLIELFYGVEDLESRSETVTMVFEVLGQHNVMIDRYLNKFNNMSEEAKNASFIDNNLEYSNIKFDIFLSHKFDLQFYNLVVYYVLTVYYGLSVYVDWIFDFNVDRKNLTGKTIELLETRMKQSNKLLFFNIMKSQTTNWMAWEVGYFSCLRRESIGILDIDGYCKGNKNVEVLSSNDVLDYDRINGIYSKNTNESIREWAKRN